MGDKYTQFFIVVTSAIIGMYSLCASVYAEGTTMAQGLYQEEIEISEKSQGDSKNTSFNEMLNEISAIFPYREKVTILIDQQTPTPNGQGECRHDLKIDEMLQEESLYIIAIVDVGTDTEAVVHIINADTGNEEKISKSNISGCPLYRDAPLVIIKEKARAEKHLYHIVTNVHAHPNGDCNVGTRGTVETEIFLFSSLLAEFPPYIVDYGCTPIETEE